jgi:GR25 family glycosyltransferase involved in LPS biosynthesis
LKDAEKACFLSHQKAIGDALGDEEHVFVLEDDACFGKRTCEILERLIEEADANFAWDILYTDICVPRVAGMAELLLLRQKMIREGKTTLLNLDQLRFGGATAYVVNRKSKAKLHDDLAAERALNIPYDLFLRDHIHASTLKGFVAFPFITSLAPTADASTIRTADEKPIDLIWNLYRRMTWEEGECESLQQVIDELGQGLSAEAKAFGTLWACMVDSTSEKIK